MPLVSILPELQRASRERWAIPLFDTADMEATEGMLAAAEERRAPCIIAMYSAQFGRPNARAHAEYIRVRAREAGVPISFMLDHGNSVEVCMQALVYGCTDVMYDGSSLPYEQNVANTRIVVQAAHAVGVAVEAEIGHVGRATDYAEIGATRKGYTDPAMVERFVEDTGVDILAIAIGTAHGAYAKGITPQIDVDLLREIRSRVDLPLVMHGGTGSTEQQFRDVVANGISKINIATDLFLSAGAAVAAKAQEPNARYFDMTAAAQSAFQARCSWYLDVFGTSGKAG
ncbi:MAG: class II fructose-bisphosphate aldolase [Anaerolineae bacterium]|jgi:fructose-bisphosphate aldolase class II